MGRLGGLLGPTAGRWHAGLPLTIWLWLYAGSHSGLRLLQSLMRGLRQGLRRWVLRGPWLRLRPLRQLVRRRR